MSLDDLKNFIHAVEHSYSLRKELKECNKVDEKIFELAKSYGFTINKKDLKDDSKGQEINSWFDKSKINPIKRIKSN